MDSRPQRPFLRAAPRGTDFIVLPLEGTRFREPLRRIKEGDIAVWQRIPVKAPFYQSICKRNVSERRNGTIWKRIKDYFLSENTL